MSDRSSALDEPRTKRRVTRALLTAVLATAATIATVATTSDALAYCRTAGCEEGVGAKCEPAQPNDCGIVLNWPTGCLNYSMQADGTRLAPFDTVEKLMRSAFDSWQQADCGGATPGFQIVETGTVACAERDFDQNGGSNANLIVFRDDDWPYSAKGVLALTTVTYGLDTGTIRDADMEINSEQVAFTFGDDNVTYDFLSVVTHEAGHFLGLAHSPDKEATMRRDYERGTTELRSLSADDVAGICAVYPTVDMEACGAPQPEGGLRGSCPDEGGTDDDGEDADGGSSDGCTVAPDDGVSSRSGRSALGGLGLVGAALVALSRRRSRRLISRA